MSLERINMIPNILLEVLTKLQEILIYYDSVYRI